MITNSYILTVNTIINRTALTFIIIFVEKSLIWTYPHFHIKNTKSKSPHRNIIFCFATGLKLRHFKPIHIRGVIKEFEIDFEIHDNNSFSGGEVSKTDHKII